MAPRKSNGPNEGIRCKNMMYEQQEEHLPFPVEELEVRIKRLKPTRYAYIFHKGDVNEKVDFEAGTIHIYHTAVMDKGRVVYSDSTKTATSNRVLPLTSSMRAYLLKVRKRQAADRELLGDSYKDSGYICVHPNGAPIRPDYVTPHFQRKLKEAGFPVIRFHDLRHSVVYALRKGGCDLKNIQAWLGHGDVTTTLNVYSHVLGGDMDKLGQVMDSLLFRPDRAR